MPGYRFCRTDDVALLVEAARACLVPFDPARAPEDEATFRNWMRERDLWCSSCMVAIEGDRLIGVLLAAKREAGNRLLAVGVRPEFRRQGHGRHLVRSLVQKLAILGPPEIEAVIGEDESGAAAFLESCGFEPGGRRGNWVLHAPPPVAGMAEAVDEVSVEDLEALGFPGRDAGPRPWDRTDRAVRARRRSLRGWVMAAGENVVAYALVDPRPETAAEIVSVGPSVPEFREAQGALLGYVGGLLGRPLRMTEVSEDEPEAVWMEPWGFRPDRTVRLWRRRAGEGGAEG